MVLKHRGGFHRRLIMIASAGGSIADLARGLWRDGIIPGRQDRRAVLFPVRIDDAVMDTTEQWADDVRRTRHIGDFTRWKDHYAYQKGLQRLLRDLKTAPAG